MTPLVSNKQNILPEISKFTTVFVLLFLVLPQYFASAQEFSDGYVSILLSYVNAAKPGEQVPVKVKVVKGNISGFAKYQSELPTGLQAICPPIENAAQSTKNDKLSVIWVSIPSSQEFEIEYSLLVAPNSPLTGHDFRASFFYIIDKDVKELKMENLHIDVTNDDSKVADARSSFAKKSDSQSKSSTASQEVLQPITEHEKQPPVDQPKAPVAQQPIPINALAEVPLPENPDNKQKDKKNRKKAQSEKTNAPVATLPRAEQAPKEEKFETPADSNVIFRVQIAAARGTLKSGRIKEIYSGNAPVSEESFPDGWHRFFIGRTTSFDEAQRLKLQCGVADAFISASRGGKLIPIVDALNMTIDKSTDHAHSSVLYAVQVAALKRFLSNKRFSHKYEIDNLVFVEKEENLYKYMVGYFQTYQEAQDFKNTLQREDAFIVAYENGQRVEIKTAVK